MSIMSVAEDYALYVEKLNLALQQIAPGKIDILIALLRDAWRNQQRVFLCGNGGSAGNALHIANDFIYGISHNRGIDVEVLCANQSVVTCLANDIGYDAIFSQQLRVKAHKDDVLIAFSGSGNSPNIVNALKTAEEMGLKTFAVVAFSGGKCKALAQNCIHIKMDDMQIAEDLQVIVGHICMQHLCKHPE